MNFLSPVFLWALPAALLPLALHLLNRRPPKPIRFSHIEWLKTAHRNFMPRKRLNEWLILIARTLAVLLAVLFFARPVVSRGAFWSGASSRESVIFLLDVSASMEAVNGGRSVLEVARDQVQSAIRRLSPDTRVGLILYSDRIEKEISPGGDRGLSTSAAGQAVSVPRPTDVKPAILQAYRMLASQPAGRKSIVVVSDHARNGWESLLELGGRWEDFDPEVRVVAWEPVAAMENRGIAEASLQLTQEGVLQGRWRPGPSESRSERAWTLDLNNRRVGQGTLPGGANDDILFQAQLPEGGYFAGTLALAPDAARFDDSYHLAGRVPRGFRLLVVDGEPALAPADAETYYLTSALSSPRDPRLDVIHVVRLEAFSQLDFNSYDVIVLANTGAVTDRKEELRSWIEKGGGLLISAGTKWPRAPETPMSFIAARPVRTGDFLVEAPTGASSFVSGLGGQDGFEWKQLRVATYVPLEKDSASESVLSLEGGDPLLVRKQIGKGNVLVLATSLDRSWTNLPAKPVFAPLMRELIATLADPLREQTSLQGWVDDIIRIAVKPGLRSVVIVAPDGTSTTARLLADGRLEWGPAALPGLYQVRTDRREEDFSFAVNIKGLGAEGNFTRIAEGEFRALFPGAATDWVKPAAGSDSFIGVLQGRDATRVLLALLFLMLLTETILAWPRRSLA